MDLSPDATRKATRVGGVVLAIVIAGLATTLVLTGLQWRHVRTWSVIGTYGEGFRGLRVGSPVRVGGVEMGTVTDIEIDPRMRGSVAEGIEDELLGQDEVPMAERGGVRVTFTLDAAVELRADARIVHDSNPISGVGELDILNVGTTLSTALPGRTGRSAMLAPFQPPGRPFSLSARSTALVAILGRKGAEDWTRIAGTIHAIESMFITASGTTDPLTGETWGPNAPGSAHALVASIRALRDRIEADIDPWHARTDAVRTQFDAIRNRIHDSGSGAPTLVPRLQQLQSAFDDKTGLRALAKELQPLFDSAFAGSDPIRALVHDAWARVQAIGAIATGLWPEMRDDLEVTRAGFVIGASELWLATGPEFWTTAVRMFQPMSARDQQAMGLILSANRVGLSAMDLRLAIESAHALQSEPGADLSPELRAALEKRVAPALQRYQRDLSDLLRKLERFAERR